MKHSDCLHLMFVQSRLIVLWCYLLILVLSVIAVLTEWCSAETTESWNHRNVTGLLIAIHHGKTCICTNEYTQRSQVEVGANVA
jgi:hypothetical protein